MVVTANFYDLFTASIVQRDLTYILKMPQILLDGFEIEAKESVEKFYSNYGKSPSPKYASMDESMKPCMVKSSPYINEPLEFVYDLVLEKLKGKRLEQYFAEAIEEYRDTGVFPFANHQKQANNLMSMKSKSSVTYLDMDREGMYSLEDLKDRIDLGFENIDEALGGLLPGEVCLLAARTGVGKSVISCYTAIRWAKQGKKVFIVSLEMKPKQLTHRMDAMLGGFNPRVFRNPLTSKSTMSKHLASVNSEMELIKYAGGEIIFPGDKVMTPGELRASAEQICPDVIIVDGVYLLTSDGKYAQSWEATKSASNSIKQTSMELSVPVFATSQFKRTGRDDNQYSLEDLAYSDALGQDADAVLSMTREDDGSLLIQIVKNRNGESFGGSNLSLDWSTMTLKEIPFTRTVVKLGK